MLKKIIALLLCVLMLIPFFSSCAKRDENDMGPMIVMYMPDEIYNLQFRPRLCILQFEHTQHCKHAL